MEPLCSNGPQYRLAQRWHAIKSGSITCVHGTIGIGSDASGDDVVLGGVYRDLESDQGDLAVRR